MQDSNIPVKFVIPFANGAGAPYIRTIPVNSQIGVNAGYASLTDGFVPLNMTPVASGGIPPFGQDMNGILKQVTQSEQWVQAGGVFPYDASFQSSIGGYPKGAIVASVTYFGLSWLSLVDNNLTNPDAGGDNWITWGDGASNDLKFRPTSETLQGWIALAAGTIGSPTSGASISAASKVLGAYTWHWTNFSNSQCPVSGGRGVSALADFNANKAITVLDMRGYGPLGMDSGGSIRLSGVPVTSGNSTTAGSLIGENRHALSAAELAVHNHGITDPGHIHGITDPTHTHSYNSPGGVGGTGGASVNVGNVANTTGASATGITVNNNASGITINNAGSGTAHNTVQNSIIGTWYLKL